MKKKKSIVILLIAFCMLTIIMVCLILSNRPFNVKYQGESSPKVVPVLYYESNIGNDDYTTHTFLFKAAKKKKLDEHRRSFSKTYPFSILKNGNYTLDTHGQLLSYYDSLVGELYIFDNSMLSPETKKFSIYLNEYETTIEYKKNEFFYNVLWNDNTYYVFCLDKKDESYDDFDTLNIYSFTNQLKPNSKTSINLREFGIKTYNIINKSFAINNESIIVPIQKEDEQFFWIFDLTTEKSTYIKKLYTIIGAISEHNNYVLVGFKDGNLVIEKISASGESISNSNIDLAVSFNKLIDENILFDDILYLINNKIYICYRYLDTVYYLSVDCNDSSIKSSWQIKNENSEMFLMDNKFMVLSKEKYYDLFPNTVNPNVE